MIFLCQSFLLLILSVLCQSMNEVIHKLEGIKKCQKTVGKIPCAEKKSIKQFSLVLPKKFRIGLWSNCCDCCFPWKTYSHLNFKILLGWIMITFIINSPNCLMYIPHANLNISNFSCLSLYNKQNYGKSLSLKIPALQLNKYYNP